MATNLLYAQSGGATPVINQTAASVIRSAQASDGIQHIYGAANGVLGILNEELIDLTELDESALQSIASSAGCFLASCRYRLLSAAKDPSIYERIHATCQAHNIGIIVYNGGNDSQDTVAKLSSYFQSIHSPIKVIGAPKTIDNDLFGCEVSPGFISSAFFVALSTALLDQDLRGMARSSTSVFLLEVMGRHAGWIAAASTAFKKREDQPPHIVLLPEATINPIDFLEKVQYHIKHHKRCVVVVAEGIKDMAGNRMAETGGSHDAFGHGILEGAAPFLAREVRSLGLGCRWALPSYLQRSSTHLQVQRDVELAQMVGQKAVEYALEGQSGVMVGIDLVSQEPLEFCCVPRPIEEIANKERLLPADFISSCNTMLTPKGMTYFSKLLQSPVASPSADQILSQLFDPTTFNLPKLAKTLPDWNS